MGKAIPAPALIGYIYMPGKFMHAAWVPAGAKAVIILEDGWKVDWLEGPPSAKDLGEGKT
jgi:hypothetical protein